MNKKQLGRKLKLQMDSGLTTRICDLLEQGCSIRTTCECVGLSQSCFFDYMRRSNPDSTDHDPRFLEFAERVTRARGDGKAELISRNTRCRRLARRSRAARKNIARGVLSNDT
jgi:hypothetical protein